MVMRKGIDIDALVERANVILAQGNEHHPDVDIDPELRRGVIAMVEFALHETGRYAGFTYQESEFREDWQDRDGDVLRADYDDTRRVYYRKDYKR